MKLPRLASIVFTTGCFGGGPAPGPPSEATVILAAPIPQNNDFCNNSFYIGPMAMGITAGAAIETPYSPQNGNCNGMQPSTKSKVYQFNKDGSAAQGVSIGMAGSQSEPRGAVAMLDNTPVFAYPSGPTTTVGTNQVQGLRGHIVGLTVDPNVLFFATTQFNGGVYLDPASPSYPCCTNGGNQTATSQLAKVGYPITGGATAQVLLNPALFCDEVKNCLIGDGSSLYYLEHAPSPGIVQISMIDKGGATPSAVDVIGGGMLPPNAVPVGFDAQGPRLGIAMAISALPSNQLLPGCWIWAGGTGKDQAQLVFSTTRFACMDVALDDTHVYFTIVRSDSGCGGCNPQPVHGDGIGRVLIGGSGFESIAMGLSAPAAGPRRVFVDPTSIYAADPFAVVRISKSALDGKHEIAP